LGLKKSAIHWKPGFRIIPTRFPSIFLYDRVANQDEFDALNAIEAMTNSRLRDENGELSLVPENERLFGKGAGPIMAAFTHLNPSGSRFSDGSYGVFYAAKEKETAIAETRFHSEKFLQATNEEPTYVQMRLYRVQIKGEIIDLGSYAKRHPDILSPTSYAASQAIGKSLHEQNVNGILYSSVRYQNRHCIAAFKTTILSGCVHAAYLEYHWNGEEINYITEKLPFPLS
jgi:hypothetical protein